MRRLIAAVFGLCLIAQTSLATEANPWAGFYRLLSPNTQNTPYPTTFCLSAILEAQDRYEIPNNLLLAIGLQEAGRRVNGELTVWPWTANYDGEGVFFGSKQAMEAWVRQKQAGGASSIDVGCMQVNQKWHGQHFASLEEAGDPETNVDYAARFLRALYNETNDWWDAAGRYHSSTDVYKDIYLRKLSHNQELANTHLAQFTQEVRFGQSHAPASRLAPTIGWSAEMTGTGATRMSDSLSIYSALPIQPILPAYSEVN